MSGECGRTPGEAAQGEGEPSCSRLLLRVYLRVAYRGLSSEVIHANETTVVL